MSLRQVLANLFLRLHQIHAQMFGYLIASGGSVPAIPDDPITKGHFITLWLQSNDYLGSKNSAGSSGTIGYNQVCNFISCLGA